MTSAKHLIPALTALLTLGVACGASPKPAISSGTVESTTTTTVATVSKAFDPQAYCVEKLAGLAEKYPKSLGGSDLAAECRKMISETDASSAKTIDVLLATAETYYKALG